MITLNIKPEDIKKLDINEGSVLILTVPSDTPFNIMNQAAGILETAGRRIVGITPQVVVMPDVYEIEKMSLDKIILLKMQCENLIAYHTKKINAIKESGDA